MPGTPTTKYAIPTLAGTDLISDIDTLVNSSLASIDSKMAGYSEGLLSARPTSTTGSPGVAGREYYATDTGQRFKDTGTGWYEIQGAGDLKPSARAAAPDGWLLCDGSSKLRSDYPALFAALGGASSPFGLPDGTHFNVPDLRGRVPVGEDSAGVRIATATGRDRGESGGAEKHTLSTAEMPGHTHSYGDNTAGFGGGSISVAGGTSNNHSTVASTTGSTGGGGAHNNMPPYQVVNWLIKT
jgi:microcystin-dependent protein